MRGSVGRCAWSGFIMFPLSSFVFLSISSGPGLCPFVALPLRSFSKAWVGCTFAGCSSSCERCGGFIPGHEPSNPTMHHALMMPSLPYHSSHCVSRYAVFCGRLSGGGDAPRDDGSAALALRRALQISCELESGGGDGGGMGGSRGGRLAPGSLAVSELVPLQMMLNDKRFYGYFAGRTQVCGMNL